MEFLKNAHRPKSLKTRKLHTAITTMPRNTVAAKAAAGPANTSDGETTIVLNPQEELAAANAEIERLRELLEARDTPTASDELLDIEKLATVFEALSWRLNGPIESYTTLLRSAKVIDPLLLTDRTNFIFNNWKLQLQNKLKVNVDYFPTT